MKRTALLFLFFVIVLGLNAQGYSAWRFGLKGSPSISWFNPEIRELEYKTISFGFSYGLFADKHFAENYAISSGFFITQHGGEISFFDGVIEIDEDADNQEDTYLKNRLYKLQYVDVPLTLKMRTREIGYFTYYGQFGVSFGFNIRAKADDDYYNDTSEEEIDIGDVTSFFKGSLIMGVGAEYSLLGNTAIVIGLYYNNGFTNTLDMGAYESHGSRKKISARPSFLELTVGILF